MRFSDEYKYFKEICNFDVKLEPYVSKLKVSDDISLDVGLETYSPRLFFDDKHDIIIASTYSDELTTKVIVSFDLSCRFNEERIPMEDAFFIGVYENGILVENVNIGV